MAQHTPDDMNDGAEDDALEIAVGDLKASAIPRLLLQAVLKQKSRYKPRHARTKPVDPDNDGDIDIGASESDKLVSLSEEKHGKPAPIPASESDFSEGVVRRAAKSFQKPSRKK